MYIYRYESAPALSRSPENKKGRDALTAWHSVHFSVYTKPMSFMILSWQWFRSLALYTSIVFALSMMM